MFEGKKQRLRQRMQDKWIRFAFGKEKVTDVDNFYDVVDVDMDGNLCKMSKYRGKILLVTNVASKWRLTKEHYTYLPKLCTDFVDKGFKILAFPCGQFMQETRDGKKNREIIECRRGIEWFGKGDVNGASTRDVFSFLKRELPNKDGTSDIRWNYAKFLVDQDGRPFRRYGAHSDPSTIRSDIEYLMDIKGPSEMELKKRRLEKVKSERTTEIFMG